MSIVLQQHYSESQLMETSSSSSTLLKLKVSNSKSMESSNGNEERCNRQLESTSTSFLQVLSDISSSSSLEEKENVYIHPLSKISTSSKLNEKSLQLCTENLGSETGTADIMDINPFIQCPNSMENPRQVVEKDSKKKMLQFPPPLTTLSGERTIQVTTHRESGRLVIKAVEATALNKSCFQAQRSHGRLRLCYLNYEAVDSDLQVKRRPNENENNNVDEVENNDEYHNQEDDDEYDQVYCNQMNKDKGEMEVEIDKDKFQRIGRCKEEGESIATLDYVYGWPSHEPFLCKSF